jgi:hypothetical protein
VKKKDSVVESSFRSNNAILLPPSKETFYIMLEATTKNDYWLVRFMKAKHEVPNSNVSFSNLFTLFQVIVKFFFTLQVT